MIVSGLVKYHDNLEALMVPIDKVVQHPENYNNGDIEEIATSIQVNGMYRPIWVDERTGYILGGNTTWAACKSLDATMIPVVWLDVDETTAYRILAGDNRLAQLARPDPGMLLTLLEELVHREALIGSGYIPDDLEHLRHAVEAPFEPLVEPLIPGTIFTHTCPSCGHVWSDGGGA